MTTRKPNSQVIEEIVELPHVVEAKGGNLGNPADVERILSGFIARMLSCIYARADNTMTAETMREEMHEDAELFSRIFGGEDPGYIPVKGWNSRIAGLSAYLKVDLGHYWQSQRTAHNDDPYQVAHAWLLWAVFDALQKDDEDLTSLLMGDRIQKFIRLLTGSLARKWYGQPH